MLQSSEWFEAQPTLKLGLIPQPQPEIKWQLPPQGLFKCNVDAAWKEDRETCGVGWLLRDDHGNVRWVGAKAYPSLSSSLETEADGLAWAMRCLDNLGFTEVIFETDSYNLVQTIGNLFECPSLSSYTDEINSNKRRFLKPSFRFQRRQANVCADMIATKASSLSLYSALLDCCSPSWLTARVELEKHL